MLIRALAPSGRRVTTAFLLGLCVQVLGGCAPSGGGDSPKATMDAYVAAVNAKDEQAVLRLVRHGRTARPEVHRLVREIDGHLVVTRMDIRQDVGPNFASVELTGRTGKGPYQSILTLSRDDGRWWLVLGRHLDGNTGPTTATTKPA